MRHTSLKQGTLHEGRLMRCKSKRISAKQRLKILNNFHFVLICSNLELALKTAFCSPHIPYSQSRFNYLRKKKKCYGEKSLLLSYHKSLECTPPNPHPLSRHTFTFNSESLPVAFLIFLSSQI